MFEYMKEVFHLLGDDKRKFPIMLLLFLGLSMLDVAGIGLIGPYAALVLDSSVLDGKLGYLVEMAGLPREQEPLLIILGLALVGIFLVKAVSAIWIGRSIIRFSLKRQVRLRSYLMQAYQSLPYTEYLRRNSSEYILNIQQLTQQYSNQVLLPFLRMLSDGIVAIAVLGLLAWQNGPALALLVGLFGSMVWFYDRLFRSNIGTYGKSANASNATMLQAIHEGIEGLKEIRILGREKYFHQVVHDSAEAYSYSNSRSQLIAIMPRYLLELLMIFFVVLLAVGTLLLERDIQTLVPTLGMFGVAALRLLPSANTFSNGLIQLRYGRDAVSRLYRDLTKLEQMEIKSPEANPDAPQVAFKSLRLENVSFSYPDAPRKALHGITLDVHAGESIGLIGTSGSGKTTLVDTLLGLLEPQEGELIYNDESLTPDVLSKLRAQVAYLPQQVFLIDNTLSQNVALGVDAEEIDIARLNEALQKARLSELVEQLPQGIDTMLGERGVRLSGGQRQRIALARAFYHGRDVLIMDEATSALDNETEREIVDEIKRLKGRNTMIVIAHRLSTLQHCDRIYRLEHGQVVQQGTYASVIGGEREVDGL